ncbi:MAG: hypothetical protein CVV18_00260 [Gammaproteobacteria bacterium HGW-Gammaproteobacteria-8]|jgi:hypothetical protein|nr:MAG: hypothetical protein CVV18_00260 [Gammaproteobacteria bacterium HGW-Gammaproteobacteria-8]
MDVIVTIAHLATVPGFSPRAGFCRKGGRRFFARYNLDWQLFIRCGINAQQLLDTGDSLALALVEHARREVQSGR